MDGKFTALNSFLGYKLPLAIYKYSSVAKGNKGGLRFEEVWMQFAAVHLKESQTHVKNLSKKNE
jgi:hypothetical protein